MEFNVEKLNIVKMSCVKYKEYIDSGQITHANNLKNGIFKAAIEIFFPSSIWDYVEKKENKYCKEVKKLYRIPIPPTSNSNWSFKEIECTETEYKKIKGSQAIERLSIGLGFAQKLESLGFIEKKEDGYKLTKKGVEHLA